jgi:hypothetical protein
MKKGIDAQWMTVFLLLKYWHADKMKGIKRGGVQGKNWRWELNPEQVETAPAKFPFFHIAIVTALNREILLKLEQRMIGMSLDGETG